MSENSYKSIRNSVIASVLAGVILLVVPEIRAYAVTLLSWLRNSVLWFWEALIDSYALPGWAWLFVFLLALIGSLAIFFEIKGEKAEPEYKKYVEDFMFGAKWRWYWVGNQISNIWCFCPRCDANLVYDDSSCRDFYSDIKKTDFICENCGHSVVASVKGGNKNYAVGAAEREALRRIRTNEYKNH
ncbi:hypothetical protein [Kistimonas asteriae]|uniref:hypothetical protein n=1 Tax=Kistimonas asteriae TaxID=517724 RepID=UPI001BA6C605|nr:hypothetical protein [Kistimonas asteriae]